VSATGHTFFAKPDPSKDGIVIPMEDFLMACRYGYYQGLGELISDKEYDQLEKKWLTENGMVGELSKPGADGADNYSSKIRALFVYLRLFNEKT